MKPSLRTLQGKTLIVERDEAGIIDWYLQQNANA